MCGIAGLIKTSNAVSYTLKNEYRSTTQDLLYSTALRGKHSTGVFIVPWEKSAPTTIIKRAVQASDFLLDPKYKEAVNDFSDVRFYIGHTRYATTGKISEDNAHPFSHGNIVLVHNGSIHNKYELCRLNNSKAKICDVDSESIALALSNNSIEDVIPKIEGAFSLVWYDTDARTLNFIRNTERPMNFAIIKGEGEPILFASEPEAIQFICSRNDIEIDKWLNLKVGHLFTIQDDGQFSFKEIYDGKPIQRSYISYGTPHYSGYSWNNRYPYSAGDGLSTVNLQRPTSNKGKALCESLGFVKGQSVQFSYDHFIAYNKKTNNEQYGCLSGIMDSQPYYPVKVHQYKEAHILELNQTDLVFTGEISSVSIDPSYIDNHYMGDETEKYIINLKTDSVIAFQIEEEDIDDVKTCCGPSGEQIPVEKFKKLVEDGCCYCASPISETDADKTGWTGDNRPLCMYCCQSYVGTEFGSNQVHGYPDDKK